MSPPHAPARAGRYELYAAIGRGATATVHLARLVGGKGFSRVVAVKRLHPELARDTAFVESFLDEARLAASVRHANVVATFDVADDGGELFLVMEHVEGASLARLVQACIGRGEKVPVPIACAIACDVLRGLEAAHEARSHAGVPLGIVHRDVSPQNVLVGSDGLSRVLDFGIAKALGRVTETRDGIVKGKLGYMPPEQLHGETLDRRADIYALGVVLWEMLVCERLFRAETEAGTVARVVAGAVSVPSARVGNVPSALDRIVLRALERDPSRRYASARAMAEEIESAVSVARPTEVAAWVEERAADALVERRAEVARALDAPATHVFDGTTTLVAPPSRPAPARRPTRLLVLGGVAATAAALAGLAVHEADTSIASASPEPPTALPVAVAAPEHAHGDAPTAAAVVSAEPPATSAPSAAPASAAPVPRRAPASAGKVSPRAPHVAKPMPPCTVPYTVDAAGRKHFRRECM